MGPWAMVNGNEYKPMPLEKPPDRDVAKHLPALGKRPTQFLDSRP